MRSGLQQAFFLKFPNTNTPRQIVRARSATPEWISPSFKLLNQKKRFDMTIISTHSNSYSAKRMMLILLGLALLWLAAYNFIQPLANWISYTLLGLEHNSRLGESLAFFFYDVPKILLLLSGMVFIISILRSFFSPERTRALLGGKREGVGNIFAAMLGIVTPFCSCSAVALFI